MKNIALIGKLGSGKDAAAHGLVTELGYTRVAFADPLKQMVKEADPIVTHEPTGFGPVPIHLSDVLRRMSFEDAKRRYREVRRSLQQIGQGARKLDPDFWVKLTLPTIGALMDAGLPVVVTDCRYPNEADALRWRGFKTVRVIRPDLTNDPDAHESETALDHYLSDYQVMNSGSLTHLRAQMHQLANL